MGKVIKKNKLNIVAMYKLQTFGDPLPFCEPSWYQGFATPYYNQSHVKYRNKVRSFVNKYRNKQDKWFKEGAYPLSLHEEIYHLGISGILYPEKYGGFKEKGDYFHEQILWDELALLDYGIVSGALSINSMASPPIIKAAHEDLKQRIIPDLVKGKTFVSLMISEPGHGSDVAGLETFASKKENHFIVNGQKKWITGGMWSDWFTTAVKTGASGMQGLSLLLLHRDMPGIKIRELKIQADELHNTTFVTLHNVKVPKKNLIGIEGMGFLYIVTNFNHERWVISVAALRKCRICFQQSIKYALKRRTFNKRLVDHQVIRLKLAEMSRLIEALQDFVERTTYQFNNHTDSRIMGGQCALLKVNASKIFEFCAREASQIFGGAAILREGKGAYVERMYRQVRAAAIPGGSEEILLDFVIRQIIGPDPLKVKQKSGKL